MSFGLFEPFNVVVSNPNDIELHEDEIDIIENSFLPSLEPEDYLQSTEFVEEVKQKIVRLSEARGRINLIEGKPRLTEILRVIENRNYTSIFYRHRNGEKGHRLIEPYAVGRGLRLQDGSIINQNHVYIRAFVIMNSNKDKYVKKKIPNTKSVSVSDKRNRWRLFRLDRIESFWNMEKTFSRYRRQYNPNDKQLGTILSSLPKSAFPYGENPKINY